MVFPQNYSIKIDGALTFTGTVSVGFAAPFDGISDMQGLYSVRRLLTAYTGNCCKLRRDSDDATSNFGFDSSGNLDTSAISTWLSGASGYLDTWYDQSGSANDATQTASGSQPLYVASSIGGKPAFDFATDYLSIHSLSSVQNGTDLPLSAIFVMDMDDATPSGSQYFFSFGRSASDTTIMGITLSSANKWRVFRRDDSSASVNTERGTLADGDVIHSVRFTGTAIRQWVDGSPLSAELACDVGNMTTDRVALGALHRTSVSNYYDGQISEVVVMDAAVPVADHNTMGISMASYYGTTWTTVT